MKRRIVGAASAIILMGSFGASGVLAQAVDKEFQEKTHMVLREHPEILVEALRGQGEELLQILETAAKKRQADQEKARMEQELKNPRAPKMDASRPSLGPAGAPIVVVEYSDFFCHYCGVASNTVKELLAKHPDKIQLVFKHMASKPISQLAAKYFEAIAMQDPEKAWKFHDAVFADQEGFATGGEAAMLKYAATLGLDMEKLSKAVQSDVVNKRVEEDLAEARSFGFTGTPMFLVNGVTIRGAVPENVFEETIDLVEKNGVKRPPSGPKIETAAPAKPKK
mgnify:CR=1 FL=1